MHKQSVVQSVRFHPVGQVMLTAGFDKRLRLFQVRSLCVCVLSSHSDEANLLIITQVDGVENKKIQSVFFADMPIRTARFTGDGSQVQQQTSAPYRSPQCIQANSDCLQTDCCVWTKAVLLHL